MDNNRYSPEDSSTWHERFTKDELQWDDLKRVGREFIPLILLVFVAVLYWIGFTAYDLSSLDDENIPRIINSPTWILIKNISCILIGAVLFRNVVRKQAQELIKKTHNLPDSYDLSQRFKHKRRGVPPLPKPLKKLARYPFITLREADDLEQAHWARWYGGPATLVIYDGVAVYLERGNQFSRVLGPGLPMPVLERYETIKAVIDLRPQVREAALKTWTKDGIEVELALRAEIQIKASDEAKIKSVKLKKGEKSKNLLYPFDPDKVKAAVERTAVRLDAATGRLSESDWAAAALGTITGRIKAYLAGNSIDELFFEDKHSPQFQSFEISEELKQTIKDGLDIAAVQLNELQITTMKPTNPDVLAILKSYWQAHKEKEAIIKEGEHQAETIRAKQEIHIKSYQDFLNTLIDNLIEINQNETGFDPDRFAESSILLLTHVLEKSMRDPVLGPLVAKEGLKALTMLKKQLNI